MLANLRDIRTMITGELLDSGCHTVKRHIGAMLANKLDHGGGSSSRLRNVIKSLLLIAANLSQSREYRDLFEDILTKVKTKW